METHTGIVHKFGPLIARILIGGMFLMAGVAKVFTFAGTAGYIGSVGLPFPELLAIVAIVLEIAGGLAVLRHVGAALPAGDHGDGLDIGFRVRFGLALLRRALAVGGGVRLALGVEAAEEPEAVPDRRDDEAENDEFRERG